MADLRRKKVAAQKATVARRGRGRAVYFAGSIRGGRKFSRYYPGIIALLRQYGTVLTEHVGGNLSAKGEPLPAAKIFKRDVAWLKKAKAVVADVSGPSHGVGYELALCEQFKKPTLCLLHASRAGRLSAMIAGNPKFRVVTYRSANDLVPAFRTFFKKLSK